MIWVDRQRLLIARQRLVETLEFPEYATSVVERFGIVGLERERAVVARQRLVEPLQLLKRIAAVVKASA